MTRGQTLQASYVCAGFETVQLSSKEITGMVLRAQKGDLAARDEVLKSQYLLLVSIVKKYAKKVHFLGFDDLFQEGCMSILNAISKYDPSKGTFPAFVIMCVEKDLKRTIYAKENLIDNPEYIEVALGKYDQIYKDFTQKNLPIPDDEELSRLLNITIDSVSFVKQRYQMQFCSLNQEAPDEQTELQDLIGVDPSVNLEEAVLGKMQVHQMILVLKEYLDPFLYYLLITYGLKKEFNSDVTYDCLAQRFGMGRSSIEKNYKKALTQSKECLEDSKIYSHVWQKLLKRYGKHVGKLNYMPIQPEDMLGYRFLEEKMDETEKKYCYALYVEKNRFSKEDMSEILGISKDVVETIQHKIDSLRETKMECCVTDFNLKKMYCKK